MNRAAIVVACLAAGAHIASADHQTFALIVTNNHSFELGRPDLQYADDDGAKYYTTFETLAGPSNIQLLTELDRDTARLFPTLPAIAKPPSKRELDRATSLVAGAIMAASRTGATSDFYFIYAGHGDVDGGRGFLELVDGRLYSDDLEALLARLPATHVHVILDSCNSFFVINARKPGGRRFATPKDAAESLTKRFPNLGVFLSTSAEAEVFEWSELQSGVFSHAVRSGLAGAADANGDGAISYDELRAFVDIATANVRNAAFRPKVYARGPAGDDNAPVLAKTVTATQVHISADRKLRVTVRDRDELPWIDVFAEVGTPITLHLPARVADGSIDELAVDATGTRVLRRSALHGDPDAIVALSDAPPDQPPETARGPGDLFRMLFTKPFGRVALAAYDADRANAPPPVFGVSNEDAERMEMLLGEIDDGFRAERIQLNEVALAGGLVVGGLAAFNDRIPGRIRIEQVTAGTLLAALGVWGLTHRGPNERFRERFSRGLRSSDQAQVVAITDAKLHALAVGSARIRTASIVSGGILLVAGAVLTGVAMHQGTDDASTALLAVGGLGTSLLGTALLMTGQFEAPIERAVRLWDGDVRRTQLSVTPTARGAAMSVSGRF
ncbi:MAG: hypothetical protein JWO36_4109 [Myxococcales bacterium]|nr:hypothetical protein [Myxococcales bacterium]